MIAFVIVAAALAFVVLNMGFSTTQKAKTTIISSLNEASSGLEIAGKVVGIGDVSDSVLNVTAVPLKIASGGDSINIDSTLTAVKYLTNTVEYDDILAGVISTNTYSNITVALDQAVTDTYVNTNTASTVNTGNADATVAFFYFSVNRNNNAILDQGEHAILLIQHEVNERPGSLDTIRAEILIPTGATLTIERQVPNVTNLVVDLG
jgi:flagellin FlaB